MIWRLVFWNITFGLCGTTGHWRPAAWLQNRGYLYSVCLWDLKWDLMVKIYKMLLYFRYNTNPSFKSLIFNLWVGYLISQNILNVQEDMNDINLARKLINQNINVACPYEYITGFTIYIYVCLINCISEAERWNLNVEIPINNTSSTVNKT